MSQYVISTILLFAKQAFSSDLNHYRILDYMGFVLGDSLATKCSPGIQMLQINYPGKLRIPFYWQGKHLDHQPPFNPQAIILWILMVSQREDAKMC